MICPIQRHFNILSCSFTLWMEHIQTQSMSQLSHGLKILLYTRLLPFTYTDWSGFHKWHQYGNIGDHLDPPGQSVMERAGVLNVLYSQLALYAHSKCVLVLGTSVKKTLWTNIIPHVALLPKVNVLATWRETLFRSPADACSWPAYV
jgi:hypothetical protein